MHVADITYIPGPIASISTCRLRDSLWRRDIQSRGQRHRNYVSEEN